MKAVDGQLVIEATGSHREVGRQVGEAARDVVAWGLDAYAARFEALAGFSFAEAVERAHGYLRPAEDYTPQAVEQLRGMSEAANVPFSHLFALNCSEEFTCAADRSWPPEHCTSFAIAAAGRAVAGHNEDWYPEEIEAQTVRIVRVKGRWSTAAYISAGPAYNLPITGVTAAGFSSAANTVYYRDERIGVPNNLLLATVLCQPDLEHARDVIVRAPRARGSNHLLSDGEGRVWDVETSGERSAFLDGSPPPQEAGTSGATAFFVHTNHYVSPELTPGDASRSEGSRLRRERAERLLLEGLEAGTELVQLAKGVLCDHENAPFTICDHWDDDDPDPDQSVTTASMVWEPAEGRAHIAAGPPCTSGYVIFSL
jgi:isopenicillin-N N-acyltransferase like protein